MRDLPDPHYGDTVESPKYQTDETAGRGTHRPFQWVEQPRDENTRNTVRADRDSDLNQILRVQWLEEYTAHIVATTEFADHWLDPRWDEQPPEWAFGVWRARKIREALDRLEA